MIGACLAWATLATAWAWAVDRATRRHDRPAGRDGASPVAAETSPCRRHHDLLALAVHLEDEAARHPERAEGLREAARRLRLRVDGLDPDAIVARWERLTGGKARRITRDDRAAASHAKNTPYGEPAP